MSGRRRTHPQVPQYLIEKKLAKAEELDAIEAASHADVEAAVEYGRKVLNPLPNLPSKISSPNRPLLFTNPKKKNKLL